MAKRFHLTAAAMLLLFSAASSFAQEEVVRDTGTKVLVREHSRTKKPFVVITAEDADEKNSVPQSQWTSRPDYRMLDPKMKSSDIPYEGPVSSRKKVYFLAAGLAAGGVVSSAVVPVAAVTGPGAAGGAGAYGAAGGAVAAGTVSTAWLKSRPDEKDNFKLESKSRTVKMSAGLTAANGPISPAEDRAP